MIKALIFDLDGTLADTELLHYRAWKKTLLNNGVSQLPLETFMKYVGTSNEKVAGDYIESDDIRKNLTELVREKQDIYMDLIPETQLLRGAREIITRYHPALRLAIASSSHKKEIMTLLKTQELESYFELVIGGDMVKQRKPDPEIYLKAQQTLGVSPRECIAFEDSEHGLNSAKNAGMYGVAIPNEFTLNHNFVRADLILTSLTEMDDEKIATLTQATP
jgi:HAD superfamily hydrolase (TIGR01509 family)